MNSYTVDELMARARPCSRWDRDAVERLYKKAGITKATPIDVLLASELSDGDAVYQADRMMTSDQRSVAMFVMVGEAELSAISANADATYAYAATTAVSAADADASYTAAAAYTDAYAAAVACADAYADAAIRKSWRMSREIFLAVCKEVQ